MLKNLLSPIIISLILISQAFAQSRCDIDGDGESEQVSISGSGESELIWSAIGSTSGESVLSESFGLGSDVAIPGFWESSDSFSIGSVRGNTKKNTLTWKILKSDGTIFQSNFGKPGNIFLSGGDFDGNEITDAAILSVSSSGNLVWTIKKNFAANKPKTTQITAGKNSLGGKALFFNPSGNRDFLGVFYRRSGSSTASLFSIDPKTKKTKTYSGFPSRFTSTESLRPLPVKGNDGKDRLAFVSSDETDTTIEVYTLKAKRVSKVTVAGKGTVAVGNYLSDQEGEEISVQSGTKLTIYNPFTKVIEKQTSPSGTVIDDIEVNKFEAATPTPTVTPTVTPS